MDDVTHIRPNLSIYVLIDGRAKRARENELLIVGRDVPAPQAVEMLNRRQATPEFFEADGEEIPHV